MTKLKLTTFITIGLLSSTSYALSPEASEGKNAFAACNACHNPELAKPLAPPMWGVKRRYLKNSLDKEDFVKSIASFAKAPSIETAIHDQALSQLGLMPAMPLPDATLKNIATYIYEENFAAPCTHWSIAAKKAEVSGDIKHAKKDRRMLQRFCQ